ncbi:MAG TPA: hypothetical protein VIW68_06805 [Candidatus Sulfotelmatobacter sp.]
MAQTAPAPPPPSAADAGAVRDLQEQVRQLRSLVEEMRADNAQSRTEMQELRQELKDTRGLLERTALADSHSSNETADAISPAPPAQPAATAGNEPPRTPSDTVSPLEDRVQKLEESASLLGSKIDEQYQTKVETASKYRARLSGIILMNAFRNSGNPDNLDFPNFAQPIPAGTSQATLGATLRQSEIGLEIFGPSVAGAKTTANLQLDFAGGFPRTGNGVNFGIVRLQTASLRMDWGNTSIIAGQDSLFLSPLSPTSFASLATPAFAFAGNLWGWTPQLRVEHRFEFADRQTLSVQAGVLDNLDWEYPSAFSRPAQAGEQSGQPAVGARVAWTRPIFDHPLSFGVSGYFGRQDWNWDRYVDAWAGMADWQVPITRRATLSGEFYRGRGIGGLGGGMGRSILFGGNPADASTPIHGLDSAGGWSQIKYQLTSKLELNVVVAEDDAFAGDVRGFATDANNYIPILGRNRGVLANVVFRPRSDLLFSAEMRRLRTFPVYSDSSFTNQLNLAMGILF